MNLREMIRATSAPKEGEIDYTHKLKNRWIFIPMLSVWAALLCGTFLPMIFPSLPWAKVAGSVFALCAVVMEWVTRVRVRGTLGGRIEIGRRESYYVVDGLPTDSPYWVNKNTPKGEVHGYCYEDGSPLSEIDQKILLEALTAERDMRWERIHKQKAEENAAVIRRTRKEKVQALKDEGSRKSGALSLAVPDKRGHVSLSDSPRGD